MNVAAVEPPSLADMKFVHCSPTKYPAPRYPMGTKLTNNNNMTNRKQPNRFLETRFARSSKVQWSLVFVFVSE